MYIFIILIFFLGIISLNVSDKKFSIISRITKQQRRRFELVVSIMGIIVYLLQLTYVSIIGEPWRAMLTDLCPNALMFLSIGILIKQKRVSKAIAPWAVIGAFFTMGSDITNWSMDVLDKREGFLNAVSIIRHTTLLVAAIYTLFYCDKYDLKDVIGFFVYLVFFVLWLLLAAFLPYYTTKNPIWGVFSAGMLDPANDGYVTKPDRVFHLQTELGDYKILREVNISIHLARFLLVLIVSTFSFGLLTSKFIRQKYLQNKQANHIARHS